MAVENDDQFTFTMDDFDIDVTVRAAHVSLWLRPSEARR